MDNPVEVLDKNQRTWYDPDVALLFKKNALFSGITTYARNLADVRATSMTVTQILNPHANFNALTARQMWLPAMHVDSRAVEITFSHHGGKVAMHEYDDLVTYWKANGTAGLRPIINGVLGNHVVNVHNMLARNALLQGAFTTGYTYYPNDATSWNDIDAGDLFDVGIAADIQLGMKYRDVAGALNPSGAPGAVVCYTTPGVIFDIQSDPDWQGIQEYANPTVLNRWEVGTYKNVRFVESPDLVLWNCGAITVQPTIAVAAYAGDGAPDPTTTKVDGTYMVGQTSSGVTHQITLSATTSIVAGDIITIHKSRTSSYGVTNGANPFDGATCHRRVISVSSPNIVIDQPLMEDFATDLTGGGVYGYVTKGQNIHASIFVGAPQAVVAGVAAPVRMHTPPPIDDLEAIYRFSWSDRMGYQPYNPDVFEVVFSAGSVRVKGSRFV